MFGGDGGAVVRLCGEACLVFGIVGFKGWDGGWGIKLRQGGMAPNNLSEVLSCASAGGRQVFLSLMSCFRRQLRGCEEALRGEGRRELGGR
jgi:hypothetical protein